MRPTSKHADSPRAAGEECFLSPPQDSRKCFPAASTTPSLASLAGLASLVGLILAIIGGSEIGNATTQSTLNTGTNLRHAGAIIFAVVYGLTVLLTAYCWANKSVILKYRQRVSSLTIYSCQY